MQLAALIRQGKLCRHCNGTECSDAGGPGEEIEIECPVCRSDGCDACKDGFWTVEGCPTDYCQSVAAVVEMIDLFWQGMPPIAGGVLDQSAWFVQAARKLKTEDSLAS